MIQGLCTALKTCLSTIGLLELQTFHLMSCIVYAHIGLSLDYHIDLRFVANDRTIILSQAMHNLALFFHKMLLTCNVFSIKR